MTAGHGDDPKMKATARRNVWIHAAPLLFVTMLASCAGVQQRGSFPSPRPGADPPSYALSVDLSPEQHQLTGRASIILSSSGEEVGLRLHPGLRITDIQARGASLDSFETHRVAGDSHDHDASDYTVRINPSSSRPELLVWWEGTLYQDPKEGEVEGKIHNTDINATVGTEGVYLTGDWYPLLTGSGVANYQLSINRPGELALVAPGEKDEADSANTGRDVWHTPYPIQELVLVGGPHRVYTSKWKGVEIELHLKPSQEGQVPGLTKAVERYLDRYEPLLGPLPTRQYRVVDNFFSSGFAFPGFTLLSSAVIDMGETSQNNHGYIDHEFVHTWFGTGILVEGPKGNWCEALTSYATNYYGYLLDNDAKGARKYRRDASQSFSKLTPEQDVPLAEFGEGPEVSRTIGYNKGAIVFHILEQQIGADAFWTSLRNLNYQRVGKLTSWGDLRQAFEDASGQDLAWFFEQWVDKPGAIDLRVRDVAWNPDSHELHISLETPSAFRAKVPIDVKTGDAVSSRVLEILPGNSELVLTDITQRPDFVAVDRDYNLIRRIPKGELVPTLDATRRAGKVIAVVDGTESEALASYVDLFRGNGAAGQYRQGTAAAETELTILGDPAQAELDWSQSALVFVGSAARSAKATAILEELKAPVRILPKGFSLDGIEYTEPGQALLATFRHPRLPGAGVTVILGNSAESLPKASNLPFYPNSIVVFAERRPIQRQDLESDAWIPLGAGR